MIKMRDLDISAKKTVDLALKMRLIKETGLGYGVTGRPETPGKANAQFRRRSKAGSDKVQWDLWVIFYKCKDNNENG